MITDQAISDKLFAFFVAIAQNNEKVISLLRSVECDEGVRLFEGRFSFTLRGIYQVLYSEQSVKFERFRSAIYSSSINEDLMRQGYSIEIFQATGKLEGTWYCLSTSMVRTN